MANQHPNILVIMTDEERYPPPYEDASPGGEQLAPGVHPGRRPRVPPALRRLDGLPAQPDHAVHGPVPLAARCGQHRWHGQEGQRPRHEWLDPNSVPTLGDWFRAGGYRPTTGASGTFRTPIC